MEPKRSDIITLEELEAFVRAVWYELPISTEVSADPEPHPAYPHEVVIRFKHAGREEVYAVNLIKRTWIRVYTQS